MGRAKTAKIQDGTWYKKEQSRKEKERNCEYARLAILKLNDFPDSLVMQPRSLEHCTVKALCILKPGNYNGCNLWACRGLVNKIGATMQHLFHNVIAAAFHLHCKKFVRHFLIFSKPR